MKLKITLYRRDCKKEEIVRPDKIKLQQYKKLQIILPMSSMLVTLLRLRLQPDNTGEDKHLINDYLIIQ